MPRWTEEQFKEYMVRTEVKSHNDTPDDGPEARLQGRCLKYCKDEGYPCLSFRQSKKAIGFVTPGWPDMTILTKDGVVFIELKSKGGRLRTEQDKLKRIFDWLGHPIHIVKSYKRFLEIMKGGE